MIKKQKHLRNAFTLAEDGHRPLLNGDEGTQGSPRLVKRGFTLAEVLITLAIIGVVAALTLPTLIQSHFEKQRVAQLKTTVSMINQAFLRVEQEYGSLDEWGVTPTYQGVDEEGNRILDYSSNTLFMTRLAKYFNGATFLKKGESVGHTKYIDDNRTGFDYLVLEDNHMLRLPNGALIYPGWFGENCINGTENSCGDFWIRFPNKKISRMGVDVFYFQLYPLKGLLPYRWDSRVGNLVYCGASNTHPSMVDRGCTAWAYYNENMDYLHCDDLNWQTKRKCK